MKSEFDYKVKYWNPQKQYLDIEFEVDKAIKKVLKSGNYILGEEVEKFEQSFANYIGTEYCVGLNSGTDALFLSLKALGVGEGDEVITTSNTFIATISTIVHCGAKPILVDVGEDGLIDLIQVERAITIKTKAVMPIHLEGKVSDMKRINTIAEKYNLYVIEDSCQALGAEINGKKAGAWSNLGCFSFYPAKILGVPGDAGAVTTDSKELYEEIKQLRDHYNIGRQVETSGTKYAFCSRLDEIHAAVLNVKLKHVDGYLSHRKRVAELYNRSLGGLPFQLPLDQEGRVWQEYVLQVPEKRDELARYLTEQDIKVRGHNLIHNHAYKNLNLNTNLLKTERYYSQALRLPMSSETQDWEVEYVCEKIKEFYEKGTI